MNNGNVDIFSLWEKCPEDAIAFLFLSIDSINKSTNTAFAWVVL